MIVFIQYTAKSRSYAEVGGLNFVARQLAWTTLQGHPAFLHAVHAISGPQRPLNVLLNDQDRCSFGANAWHCSIDVANDDRSEAETELVAEQKSGICHQGPTDRQHLLLTAREGRRRCKAPLRQIWKERIDSIERPRTLAATIGAHAQIVVDAERRKRPPSLGHHSDAKRDNPLRIKRADRNSLKTDIGQSARAQETANRPQQCALAGAVGPDDGDGFTLFDREADAEQGLEVAIPCCQFFGLQQAHSTSIPIYTSWTAALAITI